jgi:hypothetical protein
MFLKIHRHNKERLMIKSTIPQPLAVISLVIVLVVTLCPLLVTPVQANNDPTTLPDLKLLWDNRTYVDITDTTIAKLDAGSDTEDVISIEQAMTTLKTFKGEGSGSLPVSSDLLWSQTLEGYAVAAGNIDDEATNEVVVGKQAPSAIRAMENDGSGPNSDLNGNFIWETPVQGMYDIVDIKIDNIDAVGDNEVVACSPDRLYLLKGDTGESFSNHWPVFIENERFYEIAIGQLNNTPELEIAAISDKGVYVYSINGTQLWFSGHPGRTIAIGNVDDDAGNEVVVGTNAGDVRVYPGDSDACKYVYILGSKVVDIALGDLDGNSANGLEIACIDNSENDNTLAVLNMVSQPQLIWSYPIAWVSDFWGDGLAIGDIDLDYKNEVVAAGQRTLHVEGGDPVEYGVYVFDGLDRDGNKVGDLVCNPFTTATLIDDLEIGDLDGDGDQDIVVGTGGSNELGTVYALTLPHNTALSTTDSRMVYFDSDPSTITDLVPVANPGAAPANYDYPFGFFSFNIKGLTPYVTALVTVTLPSAAPAGTQWVKVNADNSVTVLEVGDNDGDNVITVTLTDSDGDGVISDPGAPGIRHNPPQLAAGGTVQTVDRLHIVLPGLIALLLLGLAGGFLLWRRSRLN